MSCSSVRQGFIEERTATINRIRGLLGEFGVVLPNRADEVRRHAIEKAEALPELARHAVGDLVAHLKMLDERVHGYDRQLQHLAQESSSAQHLITIPGVGPLTALATVATVGNGHEFANGRQFAAWLGLVPRQWSTGGKARLGHITKRGDPYLRTLLTLGARAALQSAARRSDKVSRWALALKERRGYHRAVVALAAKNARIVWAVLARESTYNGSLSRIWIVGGDVLEDILEPAKCFVCPGYLRHDRMRRPISSFEMVRRASESARPR